MTFFSSAAVTGLPRMVAAGVVVIGGASLILATATLAARGGAPTESNLEGTTRAGGQPVANAVVWLEAPGAPRTLPTHKVVLDQRDLNFWPHVLVVRTGTTVEFPNHDRVFHNVFSFRDGKRFDLGLYPVGAVRNVTFDHAGLSRIYCNIHPNMAAYVMTVDSPYFATSDEHGHFTIASVPSSVHQYHAWSPGRATLTGTTPESESPLLIQWP